MLSWYLLPACYRGVRVCVCVCVCMRACVRVHVCAHANVLTVWLIILWLLELFHLTLVNKFAQGSKQLTTANFTWLLHLLQTS